MFLYSGIQSLITYLIRVNRMETYVFLRFLFENELTCQENIVWGQEKHLDPD